MLTEQNPASVISWNVAEYIRPGRAAKRAPLVEQVLREERPAVALLQEIYAPNKTELSSRVRSLARKSGLECEYAPGAVAAAYGSHDMHTAILWNPERVKPSQGTFRFYGFGELWHAFIIGTVEIDGVPISLGSYQAPSLGKLTRLNEVERLMLAAISGYTEDALLVCADLNSLSNARKADGSYYDPDPYSGNDPHPQHVFQALWDEDPATGVFSNIRADRRPAETLSYGGLLHDAAATLGEEWKYTIGWWHPDGPHGFRRIDQAWVSAAALPALVSCAPISNSITKRASDHFPLKTIVDISKLRTPPANTR